MLTSQGLWVPQDPVQGLSGDLLEGLIGRGQERVLAITFEQGKDGSIVTKNMYLFSAVPSISYNFKF